MLDMALPNNLSPHMHGRGWSANIYVEKESQYRPGVA